MIRNSSENMGIFGKKTEPAKEIDRAIEKNKEKLRASIESKDAILICELSRALADEVDHAFSHPELWSPKKVDAVSLLLQEAAKATVGTPYEDNCAARPREFKIRLESLLEARKAVQKIREVRQSVPSGSEIENQS